MLTTVAFVLGLLGPQEPQQPISIQPVVTGEVEPLRYLWPDATAAISLRPTAEFAADMEQTALPGLLEEQFGSDGMRDLLRAVTDWFDEELDIGSGELLDEAGRHGVTLGWRAPSGQSAATWILIIGLEDSTIPLTEALDRAADSSTDVAVEKLAMPGTPAWKLRLRDAQSQFVCALVDGDLLLAPDQRSLQDALTRATTDGANFAGSEAHRRFEARANQIEANDIALSGWLDAGSMIPRLLAEMPREQRDEATKWIGHLGLDQLGAMGWTVSAEAGEIREHFTLDMPSPRPAWLEALLPTGSSIDPATAKLAPPDIVSFGVSHIDLPALHGAVLDLLEDAMPEAVEQTEVATKQMGMMLGVDLLEMLASLGTRYVNMQWADGDFVAVIDLTNPRNMAVALRGLPMFEASRTGTDELFLPRSDEGPAMALSKARLIVGSDEDRLRDWLDRQQNPSEHPAVANLIKNLSADAIGCGWTDFEALAENLRETTRELAAASGQPFGAAADSIAGATSKLGQLAFQVSADQHGYVVRVSGPAGGMSGVLAAGMGVLTDQIDAGQDLREAIGRGDQLRSRKQHRLHDLLALIRDAEIQHQQTAGNWAGIDGLIASGLLGAKTLERRQGSDGWHYGEHRIALLFDHEQAEMAQHFAVVAWPSDERRGEVYAASDLHAPMRNELLARNSGLSNLRARDLFVSGEFTAQTTTGWRPLVADGAEPRVATTPVERRQDAGERTRYQTLLALEAKGNEGTAEILPYLDDESPQIAARAAWALGRAHHEAAVPRLIQLVREHDDVEVRRYAMQALYETGDPRSEQASIDALDDSDATVRQIAATNLGALHAAQGTEALLGLVGREVDGEQHGDDRSAALLALGEIGDPTTLVPAATSLTDANKSEQQALTWLFQTLSPKLSPDEETKTLVTVLDHDVPMLRRYAIQRLGETRDEKALAALEARLGSEDKELRGLVEVSLTSIRGATGGDEILAGFDWRGELDKLVARFEDPRARAAGVAGLTGLLVMMIFWSIMRRRRRRANEAEQWASMVDPSTEFEPGMQYSDEADIDELEVESLDTDPAARNSLFDR